jgi:hypothetical protein
MIKLKTYSINNLPLTNEILVSFIENFWNDIFKSIKDTNHLLILCKVNFSSTAAEPEPYRTIGHLRRVNFTDKELYIEYLIQRLGILSDAYITQPISNITFSYIIKEGLCSESYRSYLENPDSKENITHNFNNLKLPITMEPSEYGEVVVDNYVQVDGQNIHRFIVRNGTRLYRIDVSKDKLVNHVRIEGGIDLSWIDTKIGEDIFIREIKKSTIYFMGGEIVLRKQVLPAKPFKKLNVDNGVINNFFTMDIETVPVASGPDCKLTPYLICAYNGSNYVTSYGKDQKELFTTFFDKLLSTINSGNKTLIYAHNLSGFDGIFLLKQLLSYGKVEPLLFNGRLMSIKVTIKGSNKSENKVIIFKDSYLLLPLALRKLCSAFKLSVPKGYFPFKLTQIYYTGVLPKLEYWTGISIGEYKSLVSEYKGKKMWSFQQEAIKYCKLDCQTLHEIIIKFNELIYNEFKVDAHKALTLPALAMRIYKTHYMPENTIYQLLGKAEHNIRQSYTGGAVDVYIPHNRITPFFSKVKSFFTKLYYYDVNGLYPFVMATFDMPIGKPIAFEGNIRQVDSNAFGFFYCKITSPDNLLHPILQRRIKTDNGMRSIAGLGSWEGWIFSGEMDNAIKFGYEFDIIKGYQFEKGNNIFTDYVETLFKFRTEYPSTNPMNYIAKLLLNSLYGKFGMKNETTDVKVFDCSNPVGQDLFKETFELWAESIKDHLTIDNYQILVRNKLLSYKYNEDEETYHGMDTNIAIASAITAYARVHMSQFKNNPNYKLYYSDTDCAVLNTLLPAELVGPGLGQMKLEHIITKGIFLAPKVYALITDQGEQIIKAKGLTKDVIQDINIADFEFLLSKDSSKLLKQSKLSKSLYNSDIELINTIYTLKVTSNKRQNIYINGIFDSTKPLNYNNL